MSLDFASIKNQYHHHGRLRVEGGVIPDAITAYRTYGDSKNPCIVFPTCYGGILNDQGYMIGESKVLDPSKYFIPAPYNGPYFPSISYEDNIRAQYAVLQHLGISKVYAVVGFSMGGQQSYHWAVIYPDYIEKYIVICGSAQNSFIEGPKSALIASKDFDNGHYSGNATQGVRAFARAYSAWAYGQTWFREHQYLHSGLYPTLDAFLKEEWENAHLAFDANDLITLINTWQSGDVSKIRHSGDLTKCLGEIKAKGLIMPSKTNLYFPPEDSEDEIKALRNSARLVVIDTVWGHMSGAGVNKKDDEFIQAEIGKFLAQ
ncbi:homoserine acetyltransferase [Cyathus striatus]|nr:homoserine acetyltransferase [Cyathus striatus]